MALIAAYIGTAVTAAALDVFWIGFFMKGTYEKGIGHLLASHFSVLPAVLFYFLYAAGILLFVILPSEGKSLGWIVGMGALFGLVSYGVYDLTNLATLRDWPWSIAIMDMLWGAVLTATASGVGFSILRLLVR